MFCTTNSPARKSSTLTEPVFPLTFMKSELNRFTAGRISMNDGGRIQSRDRRTFRDTERPAKLDNRDPLLFAGEFLRKPAAFDEQESPAQLLQFVELVAGDEHGDAAVAIPPKPHKFKHRGGLGGCGRRVGRSQCDPNTFMNHRITRRGEIGDGAASDGNGI